MENKYYDTVTEVLAKEILRLESELRLKIFEIEVLQEQNKELKRNAMVEALNG